MVQKVELVAAEITFKKGSSEKTATTDADGTFQIDLANGTYDVTIKKTGYFTKTIQNVPISGTLTFTIEEKSRVYGLRSDCDRNLPDNRCSRRYGRRGTCAYLYWNGRFVCV